MFSSTFVSLLCLAAATTGSLVPHDNRSTHPAGFVHQGAAPASQALKLRVGLKSADASGLEAKLQRISNPTSDEYGQWLTAEQVKPYIAPTPGTLSAFRTFAKANGLAVSGLSDTNEWIEFSTTVAQANELFGANYQHYKHMTTGVTLARTLAYSLPQELVGHVDTITPATGFEINVRLGTNFKLMQPATTPVTCNTLAPNSSITPKCLHDIYGIPSAPAKSPNTTLLVTGYANQYANRADLSAFLARERPDVNSNTTFNYVQLYNGTDPQDPAQAGAEADIDMEYTVGLATGVNTTFLSASSGGLLFDDFVHDIINSVMYLEGLADPPQVITTSYGTAEDAFAPADAKKICAGYMALGARGMSVIFASGDGGVRGGHDDPDQCTDNTFIPVFPASCPYVTAVGSTIGLPEVATNFTSGGFSNYFARPWYQDAVVPRYLDTVPASFPGVFNRSGRGFPDVAVQGCSFEYIIRGVFGTISGTSLSSPTFASMVALVNDRLAHMGKKPLGFLNPFLYLAAGPAGVFNDVTSGKNVGYTCNDTAVAFSAQKGWDPTTGFGTPSFPKLLLAAGIKSIF